MADPESPPGRGSAATARFNPWNLLLLVPLLSLVTPLVNRIEPRLFGVPFLYWSQAVFIALGVLCTLIVHKRVSPVRGSGRE